MWFLFFLSLGADCFMSSSVLFLQLKEVHYYISVHFSLLIPMLFILLVGILLHFRRLYTKLMGFLDQKTKYALFEGLITRSLH